MHTVCNFFACYIIAIAVYALTESTKSPDGSSTPPTFQITDDSGFKNPTSEVYIQFDEGYSEDRVTDDPLKIWKDRRVLSVYYMNPYILDEWKCGVTFYDIMVWVNCWGSHLNDCIPRFEISDKERIADIRVKFSGL